MRWSDLFEGPRVASPELQAWLKRWVTSSEQIEDQIRLFDPVREEASRYLNVTYPALYRGMSITDDECDTLASGQSVTVAAHRLQSWTKRQDIANDYALPGHGGEIGVLVRKPGSQLMVRVDIVNVMRFMDKKTLGRVIAADATRECEVVVETTGSMVLHHKDIRKFV